MPIVDLITPEGRRLLINARREATSVLVNGELALNFDQEGRMTGAWINGCNYRRSLDNRVIEKQEGPLPGLSYRVRRELPQEEADQVISHVYGLMAEYQRAFTDPRSRFNDENTPVDRAAVRASLEHVLACDRNHLERDRATFHRIYKPINILPPDQYLAMVLQATEGCSYNRCAFCGFYRERSFRIKSLDEFGQHMRAVQEFFGAAINLRKTIFLADANALVIPQENLLPLFDLINSQFAIEPSGIDHSALRAWCDEHPVHFEGVYSFIDAFATRRKTSSDYAALAARGLRRVYVGLESGDAELLKFLGKPNSPDDALSLVQRLKAGGVAVGIIILAGAGGDRYSEQHVHHTADIVNAMPLDKKDLVYFSELVDYAGSTYSGLARDAGIRPLTIPEIQEQTSHIRSAFRHYPAGNSPKTSYYDVREFIY